MNWLIAIIVIALVLGPIMYVLPSPKDKRIMALRMKARAVGLEVKLVQIPKLDPESHERVSASGVQKHPTRAGAAYRIAHDSEYLRTPVARQLLRLPEAATIPVVEVFSGWAALDSSDLEWWRLQQTFWLAWLQELPEEILAVSVDDRFLACCWRELGEADQGVIEAISEALNRAHLHFSS